MPDWTPTAEGAASSCRRILAPLKTSRTSHRPHRPDAAQRLRARRRRRRPRPLRRRLADRLPAAQDRRRGHQGGISADQLAAQTVGDKTRSPRWSSAASAARQAGNCDSGYSCAYSSNISWRGESHARAPRRSTRAPVFERLFGSSDSGRDGREPAAPRDLQEEHPGLRAGRRQPALKTQLGAARPAQAGRVLRPASARSSSASQRAEKVERRPTGRRGTGPTGVAERLWRAYPPDVRHDGRWPSRPT